MNVREVERMIAEMAVELDRNPNPEFGKQIETAILKQVTESINAGNCENPRVCAALLNQASQLIMQI